MKKIFSIFIFLIVFSGCIHTAESSPSSSRSELSAPANSTPSATQKTPTVAEVITINLSSFIPQETAFGKTYLEQISLFEKKYPHVKISHHYETSANFLADIVLSFRMNEEPDIAYLPLSLINNNIAVEKIVNVTDLQAASPQYAANIPASSLLASDKVDDFFVGIPINGYYSGLYYNANLFEEMNIPVPKSYAEFLIAAQMLREAGFHIITASLAYDPILVFEQLLLSEQSTQGTQTSSASQDKSILIQTGDTFLDLLSTQVFDQQSLVNTPPEAQTQFFEGEVAMLIEGNYLQSLDDYPSFARMIPFPFEHGINTQYIGKFNTGLIVSQKGFTDPAKQAMIVEFVNFMSSNASLELYKLATAGISPTDLNKPMYTPSPFAHKPLELRKDILLNISQWLTELSSEANFSATE
ncbi:ABC transporter substrate-binding protein [Candidatus Epulonipiscium viviparus]|uniref:ABC transporter substrate-binding protein n=1 Tax=Candidatus Epulonipiscium viviparus TaxID=420336 RepID=UPI0004970EB1|nr:ABC transporter substrate-binding protein [Candidatus Epulopiscium viviparus]